MSPESPAEETGPWERFVELRRAQMQRGIEVDVRQPGSRPLRAAGPAWGGPLGGRRYLTVLGFVLLASVAVSVVFVIVLALAG